MAMLAGRLKNRKARRLILLALSTATVICFIGASGASAASPWWQLDSSSWPAILPSHGEGTIVVVADNVGDDQATGSEVVFKDRLPSGVTAQSVKFYLFGLGQGIYDVSASFCETNPEEVTCRFPAEAL